MAGLLMWIPGGTLYLAATLFYAWHILAEPEEQPLTYVGLGDRV
jgi:hypothetical protein